MEIFLLTEKCIWFGLGAAGFAVLFNVPSKTLIYIAFMGALGGFLKVTLMHFYETNVIISTLCGATLIGFLSVYFAHKTHSPPPVLAIPACIPMIPGKFAYKMVLGLVNLSGDIDHSTYTQVMSETVNNGLKVVFILMSIAGGVGIPLLISRKESSKGMRFRKRK
ncbi:threonine/serine exporter family protein [Arcticibacter eurypsychrophilus]|uniref:threonine/serine exporter family protein n=1 Tax=Arcticibacter eurypsychrophilus TaxID=1434752 RepID=UPI00084D98B5|nr:threonine/serine exporter family protein [Arcticibacter eurypsychrophilus]